MHFAALGGALFALWGAASRPAEPSAPATAISRTVRVGPAELATLEEPFRRAWKRPPVPEELGDLLEGYLAEEVLFREAAAQQLDRDDVVVRRRLIEKMTTLARPAAPAVEPSEAQLRTWYDMYRHRFRQAALVSLDQLFFDPRRRGDATQAAREALGPLAAAPVEAVPPAGVGDAFVLPVTLAEKSEMQLAHLLGEEFAKALASLPQGRWAGPVTSNQGVHLVRVTRRLPERLPPFEEIAKRVRADWLTIETRGTRAAALSLLPRYQILLDPAVRVAVEKVPGLAPFLSAKP